MDREAQLSAYFRLTSVMTDLFPAVGARFLDFFVKNTLGSNIVYGAVKRKNGKQLRGVNKFGDFLVVADLNIGDAIIAQGVVSGLRKYFPSSRIDYVVKKSTKDLIIGNPDIDRVFPVYTGAPFPLESDLLELKKISSSEDYDIIINLSPMIDDKIFGGKRVINYTLIAAALIRNEGTSAINNIVHQAYDFVGNIFRDRVPPSSESEHDEFKGARVYLPNRALSTAESFLSGQGVFPWAPKVFLNPDASARYTRIPFDFQLMLLSRLSALDCTILLGAGHVAKHIEHQLANSLKAEERSRIIFVPSSFPIETYTALIDLSDVFITGDTGPLHLAAARKFSSETGKQLRNITAVFSIFGGTPPAIYGYDSTGPGMLPANQDVPSRTFMGSTPCRNITCINKMAKTCKNVRCFDNLEVDKILDEISVHIQKAKNRYTAELEVAAK